MRGWMDRGADGHMRRQMKCYLWKLDSGYVLVDYSSFHPPVCLNVFNKILEKIPLKEI